MDFKLLGKLRDVEVIAHGREIRDLRRLRKIYGGKSWSKLKGVAEIELNKQWYDLQSGDSLV